MSWTRVVVYCLLWLSSLINDVITIRFICITSWKHIACDKWQLKSLLWSVAHIIS